LGSGVLQQVHGLFESPGLLAAGTQKTADAMALAGDCLVAGGKERGLPQCISSTQESPVLNKSSSLHQTLMGSKGNEFGQLFYFW
jgi:hypothetical protein